MSFLPDDGSPVLGNPGCGVEWQHDSEGLGRCGCPPVTDEMTCGRCKKPTGNTNQGHYWAFCKVTRTTRTFHFCCPDDCELPAPEARKDSQCGTCGWMLSDHWIPDGGCPEPSRTECGHCDIGAPMNCTCKDAPRDPAV